MANLTCNYKTKKIDGQHVMLCQNSNPATSKYAAFAPEEGPCDVYVKCSETSIRVLCSNCVQRSLTNLGKVTFE
jgi:hypothetical protein